MASKSTTPSKPKPKLALSSKKLADLDETTAQTVRSINDLSHSQRAVLAALLDVEQMGSSSGRAAEKTHYSKSSAHNAFDRLEDEGLVRIKDGWPSIAIPTDDAAQAASVLEEQFDFDLDVYLYDGDGETDADDTTTTADTSTSASTSSGSSSGSSSSSRSSSSSGPKAQGFADRPAAKWDEEAPDVSGDDADSRSEELLGEMLSKALQPSQSNLEREKTRALQAMAVALLKIAASVSRFAADKQRQE